MSGTATTVGLLTVAEASRRLGVSESTVWRLLRRGALTSVRQRGRRLIPEDALEPLARRRAPRSERGIPPFTRDNPFFRLIGCARGGGRRPGAREKHEILGR